MSSNFHSIAGWLVVGLDTHDGIHEPVPTPAEMIPMEFEELVAVHPFVLGPNQQPTVKFNGVNSVVLGHTPLLLGPHLPILPDPLNMLFILDFILGSHTCWLPRSTVLICGNMATCCVAGGVSVNMDCAGSHTPISPTSLILQPGTVVTTPSIADFLLGAALVVASAAVSALLGKATGRLGSLLSKTPLGKVFSKYENQLENKLGTNILGKEAKLAFQAELGNKAGKKAFNKGIQEIGTLIAKRLAGKVGPTALVNKTLGTFGLPGTPIKSAASVLEGIPGSSFQPFQGPASFGAAAQGAADTQLPGFGALDGLVQAI